MVFPNWLYFLRYIELKLCYLLFYVNTSEEAKLARDFLLTSYGKSNEWAKFLIKWSHNNFVKPFFFFLNVKSNTIMKKLDHFHLQIPISVPIGYRNLCFEEVSELLFKFNESESENIISKIFGDIRIFLILVFSYFKHLNWIKLKT